MNKYIVQVYDGNINSITTVELNLYSLYEVEQSIKESFKGKAKILSLIVTT